MLATSRVFWPVGDSPWAIELSGSLAFVVGPAWGVKAVDVSDPSQPLEIGTLLTWGSAYDLAVDGHLLYIADDHRGLAVVDASAATEMVTVARWDTSHLARVVAHEGALVALAQDGLDSNVLLFDVGDPTRPMRIGELLSGVRVQDLSIKDGLLYVGGEGVRIFDVGDPTMPTEISRIPCGDMSYCSVKSLALVGDQLWFLAGNTHDGSLRVYNVSDPSLPILAGEAPVPGYCRSIGAGADSIATVGETGVRVFAADTRDSGPRRPDGRGGD